jgi:hypothetical protein
MDLTEVKGRSRSHWKHGRSGKKDQGYIMLHAAKHRAKARDIAFNLDFQDVVIPDTCPVLGIPLFRGKRGMANNCPSLDRIRLTEGYIKGNVRVISFRANRLKSDATIDELKKVLVYMEQNR